ncbi:hypothetical protein [Luteimonas sp. A478]
MTLIELMIALLLGLLVVGAAGMIFVSNSQAYSATETLGRIQENGRIAFELMARDLREAGATACGNDLPVANTLKNPAGSGLYEWGDGLRGYDGAQEAPLALFGEAPGGRIKGTEAVEIRSGGGSGVTVTKHNPASAVIHVNTPDHGFKEGDVLIICDYSQASIFEMSPGGAVSHVGHNTGKSKFGSGGNFCKSLSFPVNPACDDKPKDGKVYDENAIIAKLHSAIWYIGHNSRGGRSLYRRVIGRTAEEITEGVVDLDLSYYLPGSDYHVATAVPADRWNEISAIRIEAKLEAAPGALRNGQIQGTDGKVLSRQLAHVVTLRGRNP